jgi:RimJ/RimL family protein N-acetyltransferase
MMRWALGGHGITRFRVSIAPDNAPSLALAAKLGFQRTGEQMDPEDGLEYVFELDYTPEPPK